MDEEQAWQSRSESLRPGMFPRASKGQALGVSAEDWARAGPVETVGVGVIG